VNKLLITFFTLLCISITVNAKTVYVTDNMQYTLRSSESNRSKILKMLPSGTALTIVGVNSGSGYSKVRTASGVTGFILTRHTLNRPISRWYLEKANKKLKTLQEEYNLIKQQLNQLTGNNNKAISSNQSLSQERDQLSQELGDLRQTAANAVQLKHDRDQSRKKIISLSNDLKEVTHENQMLKDSTNQDWFLYGGILSFCGVILGFILPKLSWRRKTSNWDTF
jgi:SH3 domain protein